MPHVRRARARSHARSPHAVSALVFLLAGAGGCGDPWLTGVQGPPRVRVTLASSEVRVGDSLAVRVEAYGSDGQLSTVPAGAADVADTAVAQVRGDWVVGRRAGATWVRARTPAGVDSTPLTVR